MKLSTFAVPISTGRDDDRAVVEAVVERSLMADEGGFHAVYLPEHHFDDYCPFADNFSLCAYLAPQFKQAWLGLSIAVVAFHHPANLAERANLLDILTRQKFIFGIGSGGIPLESLGLGWDPREQSDALDENMDVLEAMWAKDHDDPPLDYSVRRHRGRLVQRIMPGPYDGRTNPPIKLACTRPERAIKAGQRGWAAFLWPHCVEPYLTSLRSAGHPPQVVERALAMSGLRTGAIHVADTDKQARADVWEAGQGRQLWVARQEAASALTGAPAREQPMAPPRYDDWSYIDKTTIYGSPDTVVAKLETYRSLGIDEIVVEHDFGVATKARNQAIDRSIQLMASDVIPAIAGSGLGNRGLGMGANDLTTPASPAAALAQG